MKKFISVLLTIAMMATMMSTVLASDAFIPKPSMGAVTGTKFTDIAANVLGFIQWIGYAFAVGMLLYIGIKYMMSAANEKADLKKGLINYVIGAAIVIGSATIFGALSTWMKNAGIS